MVHQQGLLQFLLNEYLKRRFLSPATVEGYVSLARQFDAWLVEKGREVALESLELDWLFEFLQHGIERGLSSSTVASHCVGLKVLIRAASKAGRTRLTAGDIQGPKRIRKNPRAWTYAEWKKLLKATERLRGRVGPWRVSHWLRALILVTYSSAQRITTVMSLKTVDVDLEQRIATFYSGKEFEENVAILLPKCVDALKAIWDPRRELVFGEWPYDRGDRQWAALNRLLGKAIKLAEIRDIGRFHAIRKTAATLVAQRHGVQAASELLSHTGSRVTLNHYIDKSVVRRRALPPE